MKILLINHYAGSKEHGMEFRPFFLARELGRLGHEVKIVAASFSHLRRKNIIFSSAYLNERIEEVEFLWLKTASYSGNGLGRIWNMLEFVFSLTKLSKVVAGHFKPDIVVASSTYPLDIFPAFLISKLAKAKLVFEIHDLWPLSPMELGGYSKFHPFIFFMQVAENFAYKFSDKVVSILPNTLQHCLAHGLKEGKLVHIPNGFPDEQAFLKAALPDGMVEKINEQRSLGRFLLGYAGGHAISNALDFLINAIAKLKDKNVHLFLLGSGDEKESLKKLAAKAEDNVTFFDPVAKSQVNEFLQRMDALYQGSRNLPLYRFGISPNKLVDYLLSGRMVIHANCAPNDLVADARAGMSIPAENTEALIEAIDCAINLSEDERVLMGAMGRDYALKHLSYSKLAKDFIAAISS